MSDTADPTQVGGSDSHQKAERLFQQTIGRINHLHAAELLWDRHFRPDERATLGGSLRNAIEQYGSTYAMWAAVRHVPQGQAAIEIGEALNLLSAFDADWLRRKGGGLPRDPEQARETAIERGDLVLTRQPPAVHWQGRLIEIDWDHYRALWEFLLIASEKAQEERPIDSFCFGKQADADVVAKRKHRLKSINGFPESLIDCFVTEGRGTQRLDIPCERIHIFALGDV